MFIRHCLDITVTQLIKWQNLNFNMQASLKYHILSLTINMWKELFSILTTSPEMNKYSRVKILVYWIRNDSLRTFDTLTWLSAAMQEKNCFRVYNFWKGAACVQSGLLLLMCTKRGNKIILSFQSEYHALRVL